MIRENLKAIIERAIGAAADDGKLGPLKDTPIEAVIEKPRQEEHGDFACGVALKLASHAKMAPLAIAQAIAEYIKKDHETSAKYLHSVEVAPPGFINIKLGTAWLNETLQKIVASGANYGKVQIGNKKRVLIEYVSANPTGDLHIGHGRNAVYGSCLANLLKFADFDVHQEFYINDAGEQIAQFYACAWSAYQRQLGRQVPYPEEGYPENSIADFVQQVITSHGDTFLSLPSDQGLQKVGELTKYVVIENHQKLLEKVRVHFDSWFSELTLHRDGKVDAVLVRFKEKGMSYESDGALWLKSKELGDERDRVLRKSGGNTTYLANDAAYHLDKYKRGYDLIFNIWGADHHGQVPGLKASIIALGEDASKLDCILTQLVNLFRDGEIVRMSKRAGTVVTLAEVVDEVGVDAVRYYLAESNPQNPISFDLELAKQTSKENPAFYIQYAHARCASILRRATQPVFATAKTTLERELGFGKQSDTESERNQFIASPIPPHEWEAYREEYKKSPDIFEAAFDKDPAIFAHQKALVLCLESFSDEVKEAVATRTPGRLARYAFQVANCLQKFYEVSRVISEDKNTTKARLGLIVATKQVLANVLGIIGVAAPESM